MPGRIGHGISLAGARPWAVDEGTPTESIPGPGRASVVVNHEEHSAETAQAISLYVVAGAMAAAIFAADLLTPLGITVWILYILPVGLMLLGREVSAPLIAGVGCTLLMLVTAFTDKGALVMPWVAYVNRAFGVGAIWTIVWLSRTRILTRLQLEREEWLRRTQMRLLESMQGELSMSDLGTRALEVLSSAVTAPVMVLYAFDGTLLRLIAAIGLRSGVDVPETFAPGEGVTGEAARSGRVTVLRDLPEGFFPLRSALITGAPRQIVVSPLLTDLSLQGVLEAGFVHPPDDRTLDLFERSRESVAVAMRAAFYRDRLRALLEETQHQSQALRLQQEQLRVANEELEQHSEILKASQARLELQQAELEANNAQLESQAQELEQRQQALVRARQEAERASAYKSEFLANMSHELRTPLNSTLILAKLLAENKGGRLSADEVRYAETISAAGNNLLTLINDILDLSKIEAGAVQVQPEVVPLAPFAERLARTFRPLAAERQLQFDIDVLPVTPATIETDPQRLQQILANLLSNAVKFTEHGSVTLQVAPADQDHVAFQVRDTGIGIAPEQQTVVFEAFRQADGSTHRKFGGTGLGLSISRELAHLLGGTLTLVSAPEKGSVFTLTVPLRLAASASRSRSTARAVGPAPAGPPPAIAASSTSSSSRRPLQHPIADDREVRRHPGRLILVIEDDTAFARILFDLAHELDFDCVMASTTDEGMALAREMAPSGILLDINLPDGSGLALLDRLKHNPDTRHIPVHMVSVSDNAQTALALGAVGFARKPVDRDEMIKAIRQLEQRLAQRVRRILVVEDDAALRASMRELLSLDGVTIHDVGTARDALAQLAAESFDCVVLDLHLPDASGYEILETMSSNERYSFPPVIVYTGGPLTAEDEERLRRFSKSVIVKGARSPERLLDEVTLFLHQVESRLPPDSRRMLAAARERDEVFEGRTILIVEDDVRNVFALTSVFEPRGATVAIARNGREGVDAARRLRPDLVLMDIMMPEMDGLTAMRALRADPDTADLPIIALTAKAMRDDYAQCLEAGASDYLAKPLDVDKLVSLSRVWISR
jgi:signal transduction histidine kinase/DNA-binding response OmpR family regulator